MEKLPRGSSMVQIGRRRPVLIGILVGRVGWGWPIEPLRSDVGGAWPPALPTAASLGLSDYSQDDMLGLRGTNPPTLERKRARAHQAGEPKLTGTGIADGRTRVRG
jgi:hypothetical protein